MNAFDKRILQFKGGEIEILDNTIPMGTIISNPADEKAIYVDEPLDLFMMGKEFQRIALLKDPSVIPYHKFNIEITIHHSHNTYITCYIYACYQKRTANLVQSKTSGALSPVQKLLRESTIRHFEKEGYTYGYTH